MTRIKNFTYWLVVGLIVGSISLMSASCDEQDLARADRYAVATGELSEAAQDTLNSPAGSLIPVPVKLTIEGVLAGLGALSLGWINYRKGQYKTAASELVYAIDVFEQGDDVGNAEMQTAKAAALNPPTVKLLKKLQ